MQPALPVTSPFCPPRARERWGNGKGAAKSGSPRVSHKLRDIGELSLPWASVPPLENGDKSPTSSSQDH